jgi:hypothetical protein
VHQTSALGLTSEHLGYHGYNCTLSSNFAGFIFDIEPGYVVSVPKIVIMILAINNHDGSKAAPPYVCGFHPGQCDSTGAILSEPYWELSSYDNTAFTLASVIIWTNLRIPNISPPIL